MKTIVKHSVIWEIFCHTSKKENEDISIWSIIVSCKIDCDHFPYHLRFLKKKLFII